MMHYHRLYRYGTLDRTKCFMLPSQRKSDGRNLQCVSASHPLVRGNSKNVTYYSRVLLYGKHKSDQAWKCHWCGCGLSIESFEADHVDEDRTNDTIENLVMSCGPCNFSRSREKIYKSYIDKCCLKIELDGKVWTTRMIAEKLGISYNSVNLRFKKGWSAYDIVHKQRAKHGPKSASRT